MTVLPPVIFWPCHLTERAAMTVTVKFPADLEAGLRAYATSTGVATSVVIREAVAQYLVQARPVLPSAAALGADLFGRYSGPADLASQRHAASAQVWADKQARHAAAAPVTPAPAAPAHRRAR